VLAVAAAGVAMDASRRWLRSRGTTGMIVPAGALALLVVWPFRDFATSGLESALALFWLASCWWLLVVASPSASSRAQVTLAVVIGLGPLVRPDFGLTSAVFLVGAWLLLRPPWRRALALSGAAIGLPFGYEIFRAGYYGTLVPLPALAKSASASSWARGIDYLTNYTSPYLLWIPLVALVALLVGFVIRRSATRRDAIVLATPLVAGVLSVLFVVRVGGDFMHGRVLLPATFLFLLPAMTLPLARITAPVLIVLVLWTGWLLVHRHGPLGAPNIDDERTGYVFWTKDKHPTDDAAYATAEGPLVGVIADDVATGKRRFLSEGNVDVAMAPTLDVPIVLAVGRLGVGGVVVPLDGIVADKFGLANPLGARITPTDRDGMAGHDKSLPWPWLFADFADPTVTGPEAPADAIAAARHAMTCGEIAELLASVREPMSVDRFFANLSGSVRRTRLVIPNDPFAAEREFCTAGE
jgi:arabinofuranosyltransferase